MGNAVAKYDGLFFLTEPSEDLPSRRRDPFGFADIANYYADLLAPGITNRNRDARWLTILCWSLEQVGKDFRDKSMDDYYEYLRGLELRWVIEACRLNDKGKRHLPGFLTVRPWIVKRTQSLKDAMGKDQWRRYRYVGPYASYRRLLQQELGLLDTDGWTLTVEGHRLGKLLKPVLNENTNKKTDGSWVDYWLRRWPEQKKPQSELIAKPSSSLRLTKQEIKLIEPLIFGDSENGKRRRIIAKAIVTTKVDNHAEMCGHIQRNLVNATSSWSEEERRKFQKLGAFAVLADTAVEALKATFKAVEKPTDVSSVAKKTATEINALKEAVGNWQHDGVWPKVDSFAGEIYKAKNQCDRLRYLVLLHIERGSGLKWLSLNRQSDNLDRAVRYSTPPYALYRFRLEALARLAIGCNVIDALPRAFSNEADEEEE